MGTGITYTPAAGAGTATLPYLRHRRCGR